MDNIIQDKEYIAISKKLAANKAEKIVEELGLKYSADEVYITQMLMSNILKDEYNIVLKEDE